MNNRPYEIWIVEYNEGNGYKHFVESHWYERDGAEERLAHLSGENLSYKDRTEGQQEWCAYGHVWSVRMWDA